MREIQDSAEKNGLSEMTLDEINAEIAEALYYPASSTADRYRSMRREYS